MGLETIGADMVRGLFGALALVMVVVLGVTMGIVVLSAMWAAREPRVARKRAGGRRGA